MTTTLGQLLEQLEAYRSALQRGISAELVHGFANTVNAIGYVDHRELDAQRVAFEKLVQCAYVYYRRFLREHPNDAAALNNIGVLLSDSGHPRRARHYFARGRRAAPEDRNIHENLRIADILMGRPEHWWHDYPETLQPGRYTLVAYFDPHAM